MSCVFFSRQKTAYEMRISDWSSDVCSSDLQVDDLQLGLADRPAGAGDLRLVRGEAAVDFRLRALERQKPRPPLQALELGTASCRESVCQDVVIRVVDSSLNNKVHTN